MTETEAHAFADDWIAAWNSHDLDGIMSHYAPEVVLTSPVAARLLGNSTVSGKQALREYWCAALAAVPDLHFDVVGVYRGASVLVINYRNQKGGLANEVLERADLRSDQGTRRSALVSTGHAHKSSPPGE